MSNKSNLMHDDAWQLDPLDNMKDRQNINVGLLVKNTDNQRKVSIIRLHGIFFYCKLSGGMINESICTSRQMEFAQKSDLACKGCAVI